MNAHEYGEITFPKTVFAKLRSDLRLAYNKRRAGQYDLALSVYKKIKTQGKGKRGFDWFDAAYNLLHSKRSLTFDELVKLTGTSDPKDWDRKLASKKVAVNDDPEGWIMKSLFPLLKPSKPSKPLKKDFAPVTSSVVASNYTFNCGAGKLLVRGGDYYRMRWECFGLLDRPMEITRKHPVAAVFFNRLGTVKRWGSGGGQIIRCDGEYVADQFGKQK